VMGEVNPAGLTAAGLVGFGHYFVTRSVKSRYIVTHS